MDRVGIKVVGQTMENEAVQTLRVRSCDKTTELEAGMKISKAVIYSVKKRD